MSLFMNPEMRQAHREVLEWERRNPAIVARDEAVQQGRAQKAKADAVKLATANVRHSPASARRFSPHSETCPHCTATFWKAHHNTRFCSGKCQRAAERAREAQRKAA